MTPNLKELARVGVQARLNELSAEREALVKMFPELKEGAKRGGKAASNGSASAEKPERKRKAMSVAARKAVGERMRTYWAKRRAEKANGAAEGSQAEAVGPAGASTGRKSGRRAGRNQGRKK